MPRRPPFRGWPGGNSSRSRGRSPSPSPPGHSRGPRAVSAVPPPGHSRLLSYGLPRPLAITPGVARGRNGRGHRRELRPPARAFAPRLAGCSKGSLSWRVPLLAQRSRCCAKTPLAIGQRGRWLRSPEEVRLRGGVAAPARSRAE